MDWDMSLAYKDSAGMMASSLMENFLKKMIKGMMLKRVNPVLIVFH